MYKVTMFKSKIRNPDLEMGLLPPGEKSDTLSKDNILPLREESEPPRKNYNLLAQELGVGLETLLKGNDRFIIEASSLIEKKQCLVELKDLLTKSLKHLAKLEKKEPYRSLGDNVRTSSAYLTLITLLAVLILAEGMLATSADSRSVSLNDLQRKSAQAYSQIIFCSKYGEIPDGNNTINACIQNRTCQEAWPFSCMYNNNAEYICADSIRYLCPKINMEQGLFALADTRAMECQ